MMFGQLECSTWCYYDNYINYIQSNSKLVQIVDDLEVADTGKTGKYLTLYLPCNNKQLAVNPLLIQMSNRDIIMSTHMDLLFQQYLQIKARKAHPFPGIKKALLSFGTLCDHLCQATFYDKSVLILNK